MSALLHLNLLLHVGGGRAAPWTPHLINWYGVHQFIRELKSTVKLYLYPTGRLLNGLAIVIRAPALDKGEPKHAEASEIIHTDAGSGRDWYRWGDAPSSVRSWQMASDGGGLSRSRCGRRPRLLLCLAVALPQIENLWMTIDRIKRVRSALLCILTLVWARGYILWTASPGALPASRSK